jgi:hypothetical protein
MAKYTHGQRVEILKVCLDFGNEALTLAATENRIKAISTIFPLHTIPIETSRLMSALSGEPTHGYRYAATWAKALIELTNRSPKVVEALNAQQQLYLEKEGRNNRTLEALLNAG